MKTYGIFGIIGLIRFLFGTTLGRTVLVLFWIDMHVSGILADIITYILAIILLWAFFYSLYDTFFRW